jgi:predicted membrane channel-forming protein YqfA (hemolysin III family)
MDEIQIGQFALSAVLMVVLGVVYKTFEKSDGTTSLPNQVKPLIAACCGIGLGIAAMYATVAIVTYKETLAYIVGGFMQGATAVGMYEMVKPLVKK